MPSATVPQIKRSGASARKCFAPLVSTTRLTAAVQKRDGRSRLSHFGISLKVLLYAVVLGFYFLAHMELRGRYDVGSDDTGNDLRGEAVQHRELRQKSTECA